MKEKATELLTERLPRGQRGIERRGTPTLLLAVSMGAALVVALVIALALGGGVKLLVAALAAHAFATLLVLAWTFPLLERGQSEDAHADREGS